MTIATSISFIQTESETRILIKFRSDLVFNQMMEGLSRKQKLGIIKIAIVLFGILVFPILVNRFLGIETMKVLFVIVVIYAIIAWRMKRN